MTDGHYSKRKCEMSKEGVRKMATGRQWSRTAAIDNYSSVEHAVFCLKRIPFLPIKVALYASSLTVDYAQQFIFLASFLLSDSYPAFFLPIATTSNKKF